MGRWTRGAMVACAAVVVAVGLAACGDDGATGDDADLTVYSGRSEDLVAPLFERFTEDTGVTVSVRYGDTAEMAATIIEEGGGSPADVYYGQDAGALGALAKEDALATLSQETLGLVEERFRSPQDDWVATSGRVRVLGYDNRVLQPADLPDSVFDLTGEEWNGRVGWAPTNGSFQAFVTAMRVQHGDARTEEWLREMDANGTVPYDNNILIRDAIANGEVEVGLLNHYYMERAKAELRDPGEYPVGTHVFPGGDVGSLINVAGTGVVAASDDPEAAERLVAYLLSAESQEYFAEETREYPVTGDVPPSTDLPELSSIQQPQVDLNDLDDLRGTLEVIERAGVL